MPRVSGRNTGGSLAFNGSTSLINVTANSVFNTNVFTYTAIVFPTGSGIRTIKGNATTNGPQFRINGSNQLELVKQTVTLIGTSTSIVPNNKFSYVACTYDVSGNYVFYINGLFAGSGTNLQTFVFGNIQIGSQSSGTESFKGKISSFQMYSTAFTSQQIKDNYFSNISNSSTLKFNLDEMTGATATDTSGNGNNGTIVSGTWSTDRPFANRNAVVDIKSSLSFDGISNRVALTTRPAIELSNGTVFARFKTGDAGTSYRGIIVKPNAYGILIRDNILITFDWGAGLPRTTGINLANNSWHDVAVTFQSGVTNGTNIYIDGQLVLQTTITVLDQTFGLSIGAGDTGGGQPFKGNISYSAVIPTVLTTSQVLSLYNTKTTSLAKAVEYKLTEGAGSIAYDSSGNANNGTITGATWSSDTPSKARKQVGGNMIANGDFSYVPVVNVGRTSGGSGFLDGTSTGSATNALFGWSCYNNVAASIMFDTATLSPLGSYSLKASLTGAGAYTEIFTPTNVNGLAGYFAKTKIPVLPNTTYTLTFYMKTNYVSGDSNDGARLAVIGSTGDGTTSSSNSNSVTIKTTTDWTLRTLTWTTSATTRFAQINPLIYGHTGAATLVMDAWFANITLTPTVNITRAPII